jgi:DNA-binding SARP family transcriptional activator
MLGMRRLRFWGEAMGDEVLHQDELEIRLLGPTLVRRRNGEAVAQKEWRTAKSLELVRSLALSPDEPVAADELIERLWPDVDHAKAQSSLRNAVFHVRRVLGEDALERRAEGLALHNAWTDVRAYAALADQIKQAHRARDHARVAALCCEAEALYVRDIEIEGSGEWVAEAQRRWRGLRLQVLLASAESAVELCRMREALDLAKAAIELDATSERATRVVMRAFGALGEAKKALGAYDRLRAILADTYGIDPAPQTRALHLDLLTSMSGAAPEGPIDVEPLVGHDRAVEALTAVMLQMAGAGGREHRPGVVWLVGAQGSGREAVARAASHRAGMRHRRTSVPVGRIANLLSSPPQLRNRELLLVPEVVGVTRRDAARLHHWAVNTGSLVVVPVDALTVEARLQVLDDAQASLAHMVEIDPLPRAQVVELLAHMLQGAPAPELVDTVMARTDGRSGEVCTSVRRWLRDGRVIWTPGGMSLGVDPDGGTLFPPMRGVVRSLGVLNRRSLEALAVVAAAEEPVTAGEVDVALGQLDTDHPGDAHALLNQLADARAVRVTPDGYVLRNEHDRTEIFAWLRPARRRRVHSSLTRLTTKRPRRLVEREEPHPDEAVDALTAACRHGDFERARELLDTLSRGRSWAVRSSLQAVRAMDFTAAAIGIVACA